MRSEAVTETRLPTTSEKVFSVFVLFFSTNAFWRLLQGPPDIDGVSTGAPITNAVWIALYSIVLFLIHSRCAISKDIWRKSLPMLLPILVAVFSLVWSEDRVITFFRCGALIGTTAIALYIALRFTLRQTLGLVACALGIAAVSSAIVAVLVPSFGVGTDGFEGMWLGAFGQKNDLGTMMTFAFLVFLLLLWHESSHRIMWLSLTVLSLLLVVKADSMSSFVVCCSLPFLLAASDKILRKGGRTSVRLACFALPVLILFAGLALKFDTVIELLGRDEGFTGRTKVWALVSQAILDKPYLGYGYQAFWRGFEGTSGDIWNQIGFQYYSHNGFLEVLLGMGLLGLAAILIAFGFYARNALRLLRKGRSAETAWPWALFLCLLGSNLLEGNFMKSNNLPWLLYLIAVFSLSISDTRSLVMKQPLWIPATEL